jgi:hypothetical protein
MKNFDYNTVYPTIVDAVDCILKLSESVNDEELEKSCEKESDKHEISFEETSIAYFENLKNKHNSMRNSKKHSASYKIEEEDLDYYRKQSLTNNL